MLVLGLLAGCYSPHYENCEVSCATSHACPSGFECDTALGLCHSPGGSCSPRDGATPRDASADAPYGSGPWGPATMVALSQTNILDPTLTSDMLEMYVQKAGDIYVTKRATVMSPWETLTLVAELSSSAQELSFSVAGDGLTMIIATDRSPTQGLLDLWVSTRSARTDAWGPPASIPGINSPQQESGGTISIDRQRLYFGSTRLTNMNDIFVAVPNTFGTWDVTLISELSPGVSADGHPNLSPDELTIYFNSNRNAGTGYDLFESHRDTLTDAFDPPTPISELNSPNNDADPWVSPDGHHIFFSSDRGASGLNAVYEATR